MSAQTHERGREARFRLALVRRAVAVVRERLDAADRDDERGRLEGLLTLGLWLEKLAGFEVDRWAGRPSTSEEARAGIRVAAGGVATLGDWLEYVSEVLAASELAKIHF